MNWNLEYLFTSREEFLKEVENVNKVIDKISDYRGKLKDLESLKKYFLLKLELEEKLSKVYQYASLKSDLNKKDVQGLTDLDMCANLINKLVQASSFESPELLTIDKDEIINLLKSEEVLTQFIFEVEDLFRQSQYVLDDKSESLLAKYSPIMGKGRELYSSLAVSDNVNGTIKLSNGEKVQVTNGNFSSLIADNNNPKDRKKIFDTLYKKYEIHKNTYASIYNLILQKDKAQAASRGYDSILDSYLFGNNIPTSVYYNLVEIAGKNSQVLKRYIKLRKKYFGLKKYCTYDRFLQMAKSPKKYTYEEAKELFFASVEKYPDYFKQKAHEVLEDGFVDVYEKDGKRTGAYSSSQPNLHPFILLNYDESLDDVFTVAHESGHSMHSLFAHDAQPTMLQGYRIFVAEIASTFNEHNLLDYLINSGLLNKEEKILLLQKSIDSIVSTFYRQTLFAEYELIAHQKVEKNEPINYVVLSNIMIDLYKKYYGIDISKEGYKQFVWAYIPHLYYTPFYVYQYATSFAASFKIYQDVKEQKEGAFEKYVNLLKAGGSKYPVDEAHDAGVDFTDKNTFMAVINRMKELVDQLEKLIK